MSYFLTFISYYFNSNLDNKYAGYMWIYVNLASENQCI